MVVSTNVLLVAALGLSLIATAAFFRLELKPMLLAAAYPAFFALVFAVAAAGDVLFGALIVAKVVLVLEKVPLEAWIGDRAALTDVIVRSGLYGLGILLVLLVEKAFELRHEYGGFVPALTQVFRQTSIVLAILIYLLPAPL